MLDAVSAELTPWAILNYWMVPVGLFILYRYGTFRFNTPDYDIVKADGPTLRSPTDIPLVSLAPPRFTTTRRRFRRCELRYIMVLEGAFLLFVFAWPLIQIVAKLMGVNDLGDGTPTFRAVTGLLLLTGVLSSIPGIRDIDRWLLTRLHEAALIPGNARRLAENLFEAPFKPSPAVVTGVRNQLVMRDTIRVAEGKAAGSLETAILRTLCLKDGLKKALQPEEAAPFQVKMERDIQDLERATKIMVDDARRYLRDQEHAIGGDVSDIDAAIEALDTTATDLRARRAELVTRCDSLTFRMCLLSALLTNVSTDTPDQASATLRAIGFSVELKLIPVWDAEALMKVVGLTLLAVLLFNLAAMRVFALLHLMGSAPAPDRDTTFVFSLIITCLYGGVIVLARSRKRSWAREDRATPNSPNLMIAVYSYMVVVGVVAVLGLLASTIHAWPAGPAWLRVLRMAAGQAQFAIAGWFAAIYIDREGRGERLAWTLVAQQALWQLVAGFIGSCFVAGASRPELWIMTALQSALAGAVLSYCTQRFSSPPGSSLARTPQQAGSLIGDMRVLPIAPGGGGSAAVQGAG